MYHTAFGGRAPPEPAGELTELTQNHIAAFRGRTVWRRREGCEVREGKERAGRERKGGGRKGAYFSN